MTAEKQRPRLRLFIALDLPAPIRESLAEWGARNLADPALRPVSAVSLHVTLAFLGQRDAGEVEPLAMAMGDSAAGPVRMSLSNPESRPRKGRPRLFALPARSRGAVDLQAALAKRLAAAALFESETRPLWPHVTVARVRPQGGGSKRPSRVERAPGALPVELSKDFLGVRMTLYRSEPQPSGARYAPLAQVELSSEGGSEVI